VKIEAIKPGFINFYLNPVFLSAQVESILKFKGDYGRSDVGRGEKIQLEFISANPTGPLTVGNGRGGFYGDVLGNVMTACDFNVTKEYLINDAGNQITSLGHSVLKDEQAVYSGDYINDLHERIKESNPYQVGQQAAKIILDELLKPTVEEGMKVKFDNWFSEDTQLRQTKKIDQVIDWLKQENFLYEKDNAWWFKSSEHGDTRDRVLVKTNGEFTYLAQDFAYLVSKFKARKFSKVINIWGADHHGDVAGLLAAAKVLGYAGKQEVILMQFVKLFKDGQEVRMSKRRGTYVAMSELLEMVGHDAVRFLFLMYSNNTHINFDLNLAQERSEKNPVYYVQYAYARISGILRQKEVEEVKPGSKDLEYSHEAELSLAKLLIRYPEVLAQVALDYEVQKLPSYALEIADKFHQFYHQCRVINEGKIDLSRLELVRLTKKILGEVLAVIGISAPEKM
ncbi:MAG: arginine--tRNA ligase, partial [Candidatus Komeilibacteria bacterium]|nr:arginine--tRNA ligase [Candidatus Komeilibacteria bacterium]